MSAWRLKIDGPEAVASRSLRAMFAPYLPLLALTILWYPITGFVLLHLDRVPDGSTLGIVVFAPLLGMALWVPRLVRERLRIPIAIEDEQIRIDRVRVPRMHLVEIVVLPERVWFRTRHRVLVTFESGDFVHFVQIVSERDVEDARGTASELATWLAIPLTAAASPPPRAIVRPR